MPLAFVALLALAVHVPNLPVGKSPQEDAGVFLYVAQTILDGGAPYRDVWDHKMPLVYYLDALGLLLGGGSSLGVWALQALGHVAAAVLGYRALASAFGPRAALFGSAVWVLAAPRVLLYEGYFVNFVQVYLAPLQLSALALVAAEARRATATWRSAALGATGAAAGLLTPTGLAIWVAAAATLALLAPRPLARRAALAFVAGLAVVAPFGLLLAAQGALPHWLDQAIGFNGAYTRAAALADRVDAIVTGLRLMASSGAIVIASAGWAIAAIALARGMLAEREHPLVLAAVVAMPLELVFTAASGRPFPHYYLAWLPAIGLLAAVAARAVERRVAPRTVTALLFAALALLAVRPVPLLVRVAASREDGIARAGIEHVRSNSTPTDLVFIWGSRTEVLVGAERRAPTRYVFQYAPLGARGYASSAHFDELLAALERRPPLLIVDAAKDSPVTPPLTLGAAGFDTQDPFFRVHPDVERVVAFVAARYERTGTVEPLGWPVYRYRAGR